MSISFQENLVSFVSDGIITQYSFNFKVFEESHLKVIKVFNDVQTTLSIGSDYTVTLNEAEGGVIDLVTAAENTSVLFLVRETPIEQDLEISEDFVNPKQLENKYDYLTTIAQDLKEIASRTLKVDVTNQTLSPELPTDLIAGDILSVKTDGTGFERNDTLENLSTVALSGQYIDVLNAPNSINDFPEIDTTGASLGDSLIFNGSGILVPGAGGGVGGAVNSIAGQVGDVTLVDLNLDRVDNVADSQKPISVLTQSALDVKADTSSLTAVATSGDYADLINTPVELDDVSTLNPDFETDTTSWAFTTDYAGHTFSRSTVNPISGIASGLITFGDSGAQNPITTTLETSFTLSGTTQIGQNVSIDLDTVFTGAGFTGNIDLVVIENSSSTEVLSYLIEDVVGVENLGEVKRRLLEFSTISSENIYKIQLKLTGFVEVGDAPTGFLKLDNLKVSARPKIQDGNLKDREKVIRFLPSNIEADDPDIAALKITGLVPGISYGIFGFARMVLNSNSSASFRIVHGVTPVLEIAGGTPSESGSDRHFGGIYDEFVASATDITVSFQEFSNAILQGTGAKSGTHVWIKRLDHNIKTVGSFSV